jgi:hypothetical protein
LKSAAKGTELVERLTGTVKSGSASVIRKIING